MMMTPETVGLVALLAATMTFTPGPANLALVGMASRYGFAQSVPFLAGVVSGYVMLGSALAMGLAQVIEQYPLLLSVFRWVGVAYLLYLAWKLVQSTQLSNAKDAAPGYLHGLIIHPLNPKAWMMFISAFGQFAQPNGSSWSHLMLIVLIFSGVGLMANTTWCYTGGQLQRWLNTPQRVKRFNGAMASALVGVVLWVSLAA